MHKADHHHQSHAETNQGSAWIVTALIALVVWLLFWFFCIKNPAFTKFAEDFLRLDVDDLKRLPIGMFMFAAFWFICDRIIFKRCVALMEEREALTSGAGETAHDTRARAEEIQAEYEEKLTERRVQLMRDKMSALTAAEKQAQALIAQAQNEAQAALEKARAKIKAEFAELAEQNAQQAEQLAQDVVNKLTEPQQAH